MARTNDSSSTFGGGVAGKITDQVVRGKLAVAERLTPHLVRTAMGVQEEFFRLTGSEVKATIGPLWAMMADHPDAPDWLRKTGNFVARGHGQWQTLLAGSAVGAGMGGGILDLIRNEMAPVIGPLIAANPHLWLSVSEAAAASVRGLGAGQDYEWTAAKSGIDAEQFEVLRELNTTTLGPSEIIELYRRGEIDQGFALRAMRRVGMDGDHARRLLSLARLHITLADAGQMWNRGIVTTDELVSIAEVNGFTEVDAHRYSELGGEPPSPELLYGAFRRGFIDQARLRRGIVQGPIRNEWLDVIERMQYHSMTPEQAASAVTQGHLTLDRAEEVAKEYGLNPDDIGVLIESAGLPPGIDFATEAFLRGFITDGEFGAMFLESRIKNKYLPLLRQMRTRLIPQETARSLVAKGVLSRERGTTILAQHGFTLEDTNALLDAATADKTQATRDLSLSATRDLYAEQEITAETAVAMLMSLGYDQQEAEWELALADLQRLRTFRNAVIGKVRAGFVKGFFDDQQAGTTLDSLSVPPGRRDDLIQLWTIERETVTRDLTPAQLVSAAKGGHLDVATVVSRLVGQGYDQGDALVLLRIAKVPGV